MMNPQRRRRLITIGLMVLGIAVAAALVLYALRTNINLYFTPSQVDPMAMQKLPQFRMGGLVEKGSVIHDEKGLGVHFQLTDYKRIIAVHYNGILPALFREGQGLVVQGHLNEQGEFMANQVLAKHDEKYMPPSIKKPSLGSQEKASQTAAADQGRKHE
jgi:cytochrome c-type biogenesis protein CcmE